MSQEVTLFVIKDQLITRHLLNLNTVNLLHNFNKLGPSLRVCIDLERGDLSWRKVEENINLAAQRFVQSANIQDVSDSLYRDPDGVPHLVFSVRPASLEHDGRQSAVVDIPTNYLKKVVASAFARSDGIKRISFFTQLSRHPKLRGACGYMFELLLRVRLTAHANSDPLVAIPKDPDGSKLNIPVTERVISLSGITALKQANQHTVPFCWWPTSCTFSPVDAIVCTATDIIFVQSTISQSHNVNIDNLTLTIQNLPERFRQTHRLCFVFVANQRATAVTLMNQKLEQLKDFSVYSCYFDISAHTFDDTQEGFLTRAIVSGATHVDKDHANDVHTGGY